jgi:hypothetical protein
MIDIAQNSVYLPFDALPPPAKAIEAINHGKPMAGTSTWGKDRNINIDPEVFKK